MDADAGSRRNASALARVPSWIWIGLVFLLGLLPALADSALYHGDERFYTDAALAMERTGELVPRYADGRARVNKPLLAYGAIVASHAVLGVGLLQSRLPFALAGAALVMLAGAVAARLGGGRAGTLAALLAAANPDVLALSTRSTPDILLCAAALLALDGAARVLLAGEPGALRFWLGVGLATAAKGLWGPLLLAFVGLAGALQPRTRVRLRDFLRAGPFLLGAALGAAGVAPLFLAGAREVVAQGGEDQLRAAFEPAVVLRNAAEYLPSLLIHFLPWTALVAGGLLVSDGRRALAEAWRAPPVRAALCFWGVLALVFLPGSARRVRYLAPAFVPVAIALGLVLERLAERERSARLLRGTSAGLGGLVALALGAAARACWRWQTPAALALLALASACLVLVVRLVRRPARDAPVLGAGIVLCAALAFTGVLRPALAYSPLPALAARLGGATALGLAGIEDSLGARLRLVSGGRIEPVGLEGPSAQAPAFVLATPALAGDWRARGYATLAEFEPLGSPRRADLVRWWREEEGAPHREAPEERLVLLGTPGSSPAF